MMGCPPCDVLLLCKYFFPVVACAFLFFFVLPLRPGTFPRSLSYFFGRLVLMLIVQVGCLVEKALVFVGNVWLFLAGLEVPRIGPTLIKPCRNMRSLLIFLFLSFCYVNLFASYCVCGFSYVW